MVGDRPRVPAILQLFQCLTSVIKMRRGVGVKKVTVLICVFGAGVSRGIQRDRAGEHWTMKSVGWLVGWLVSTTTNSGWWLVTQYGAAKRRTMSGSRHNRTGDAPARISTHLYSLYYCSTSTDEKNEWIRQNALQHPRNIGAIGVHSLLIANILLELNALREIACILL